MQKKHLNFLLVFMVGALIACSSGGSHPDLSTQSTVPGTGVKFTYEFSTKTSSAADSSLDLSVTYADEYSVPLIIQKDGMVSLRAADFPKMVLRLCKPGTKDFCDVFSEKVPVEIDLVFDVCDIGRADKDCGKNDPSVFNGTLSKDGSLSLNALPIRLRVFLVTSEQDGFTASDTDGGVFFTNPLPRIVVSVGTGTVTAGALSETGSKITNKQAKLVGGGLLPQGLQDLSGVAYLAILNGSFNMDPLALLE